MRRYGSLFDSAVHDEKTKRRFVRRAIDVNTNIPEATELELSGRLMTRLNCSQMTNFNTRSACAVRRRTFIAGAATLGVACFLSSFVSGCGVNDAHEATAADPKAKGGRPAPLVRVTQATKKTIRPRVVGVGTTTPRWMSIVASGADGVVSEFYVEQGDYVERSKPLAKLRMVSTDLGIAQQNAVLAERDQHLKELEAGSRSEDVEEAEAKMFAAEAIMKNTSDRLSRVKQLFDQKAINRDELDAAGERAEAGSQVHRAAKAVFERVKAGERKEVIEQARARVTAQREHVAFLEAEKGKRTTLAPFDGYVVQVQTFVGQWLSKGDPVLTLSMLDEIDVVVNVDQSDLKHVRLGSEARVHITGTDPADWTGKIVAVVPRSDWRQGSRNFPVEIRLNNQFFTADNQKRPVLKEGMIAEVTIEGEPVDVVLVPKDALVRTSRGTSIFTFAPSADDPKSGTTAQVSVELGTSEGKLIEVIPKPAPNGSAVKFDATSMVVTEGAERLRPFPQDVRIAEGTTPVEPPSEETAE